MAYIPKHSTYDMLYRNRIKVGVIVIQILFILLFRFWPESKWQPTVFEVSYDDRQIMVIDLAAITEQASPPPSPARPYVPINPILDPVIDVTQELDLRVEPISAVPMEGVGTGAGQGSGTGSGDGTGEARLAQRPARPPSVVRIVEPVIPEEARKAKIRAEITVRFLVGADGLVEDAEIAEIKIYDNRTKEFVLSNDIGYGLKDVTLQAAQSWRFRPAEDGGEKVKAWSRHLFTFGN